jgi:hypothetical protein
MLSLKQLILAVLDITPENLLLSNVDRDSSVGIATCYGLDGRRIESQWGRDFPHSSRPAAGLKQPPIQWVPGHSRG